MQFVQRMCCGPESRGSNTGERRKDFSGELGQRSLHNCAAGWTGRGSNTGKRRKDFSGELGHCSLCCGPDEPGFESRHEDISGPTKPPIQWVPVLFLRDSGAEASR